MMTSLNTMLAAASVSVGALLSYTFDPPLPDPHIPIELRGVAYDATSDSVIYSRTLHHNEVIRATVITDFVDPKTERSVEACYLTARADFKPSESEVQSIPFARFAGEACKPALTRGRTYEVVSTVIPPVGEGDQIRAEITIP